MIIFDLDTLANNEHRRHFVNQYIELGDFDEDVKPDWKSFYEACDKDEPINHTINLLRTLWIKEGEEIEIWSGRCESVREKTLEWITTYVFGDYELCTLKMRPIGNNTPDDQLKERWLDEYITSMWPKLEKDAPDGTIFHRKDPIEFVFDSDPQSIKMWRRRGIFVFNCCQHDEEF